MLLVLTVVLGLATAVLWLVGTSSGVATALRLGVAMTGSGQVNGVSGSLWSGLSIEELDYRHARLDVHARQLRLEVDWPQLKDGLLRVREMSIDTLYLGLRQEDEPEPAVNEPMTAPSWPQLPIAFDVRTLKLRQFTLAQNGFAVPLSVTDLAASLQGDDRRARLQLDSLFLRAPDASVAVVGALDASGALSAHEGDGATIQVDGGFKLDVHQGELHAVVDIGAQGALDDLAVSVVGEGEGMAVDAQARLAPFSPTLPLSALSATVRGFEPHAWVQGLPAARINLTAQLNVEGALRPVGAEPLANTAVGEAGGQGAGAEPAPRSAPAVAGLPLDAQVLERIRDVRADLKLTLDEGSRWQQQALRGVVDVQLADAGLPRVHVDLGVGRNAVGIEGTLKGAADQLDLTLDVPEPQALWPGLSGAAKLTGRLKGGIEQHAIDLSGQVSLPVQATGAAAPARMETVAAGRNEVVDETGEPALDIPSILKQGPVRFALSLEGAWKRGANGQLGAGLEGWRGNVTRLDVRNPQVSAVLGSPMAVGVVPGDESAQRALQWSVGAGSVQVNLPARRSFTLQHAGSSNREAQWRSAGRVDGLVPAWVVAQLPRTANPLRLDLVWDLAMTRSLEGEVSLRRRGGDLSLPGEPPIDLGLQSLEVRLTARPANGNSSNIAFSANVSGTKLGRIDVRGSTIATAVNGVPEVSEQQPITLEANLAVKDLSWLAAFAGDATDIGGAVAGEVRATRTRGVWNTQGRVTGSDMRVVRLDDGVRLLDGSLQASFNDSRIVIDRLYFPSVIRSAPKDSRVQSWLANDSKGGSLQATGTWSLDDASGDIRVTLDRYPVVQRADRFIAGSGTVDVAISPTRLQIRGKVMADVGWVSLEGASDLPSLASDVVIVRAGDAGEREPALPMLMNLEVDLGKRFYLRGMGLDTGLQGSITVRNQRSGMRANGVVSTHQGQFSIYGQTLVVRRGEVTFEGLLDDPLLDIVAVRPNLRIEAGVQVSGTARNPIITLISFPDVPEVEKLSWLLLGRGPDASGADAGMLLSAAASLLSDEDSEPIYRQLGLDELGLRSGESSSVRGLLPEQTVVTSIGGSANYDVGTNFLVVGKRLSNALYLTFEQALSGRENVVRLSYRISDTLTASLQGGTVNGLRLVWSLIFDD